MWLCDQTWLWTGEATQLVTFVTLSVQSRQSKTQTVDYRPWLACLRLALRDDGNGNTIQLKILRSAVCILPMVRSPLSAFYSDRWKRSIFILHCLRSIKCKHGFTIASFQENGAGTENRNSIYLLSPSPEGKTSTVWIEHESSSRIADSSYSAIVGRTNKSNREDASQYMKDHTFKMR